MLKLLKPALTNFVDLESFKGLKLKEGQIKIEEYECRRMTLLEDYSHQKIENSFYEFKFL